MTSQQVIYFRDNYHLMIVREQRFGYFLLHTLVTRSNIVTITANYKYVFLIVFNQANPLRLQQVT